MPSEQATVVRLVPLLSKVVSQLRVAASATQGRAMRAAKNFMIRDNKKNELSSGGFSR